MRRSLLVGLAVVGFIAPLSSGQQLRWSVVPIPTPDASTRLFRVTILLCGMRDVVDFSFELNLGSEVTPIGSVTFHAAVDRVGDLQFSTLPDGRTIGWSKFLEEFGVTLQCPTPVASFVVEYPNTTPPPAEAISFLKIFAESSFVSVAGSPIPVPLPVDYSFSFVPDGYNENDINLCPECLTVPIQFLGGRSIIASNSAGVLPFVIHGSANFDPSNVDPDSVELEGFGVMRAGKSGELLAQLRDVDKDGFGDLFVLFDIQPPLYKPGETGAILTGKFFEEEGEDEIFIRGTTTIRVVGDNRVIVGPPLKPGD